MKKVFIAAALVAFTFGVSSNSLMASDTNATNVEWSGDKEKKEKKKKKDKSATMEKKNCGSSGSSGCCAGAKKTS